MFDFLEEIVHELKAVPGLSFLSRVHERIRIMQDRFRRKTERVRIMRNSITGSKGKIDRLREKTRASKRRNAE